MDRQEHLKKLQSYQFAMYDMLLYLDTHPDDKKAFSMYQDLAAETKKAMRDFEKMHGPLTIRSAADFDTFRWLESPWPWDKEGNE